MREHAVFAPMEQPHAYEVAEKLLGGSWWRAFGVCKIINRGPPIAHRAFLRVRFFRNSRRKSFSASSNAWRFSTKGLGFECTYFTVLDSEPRPTLTGYRAAMRQHAVFPPIEQPHADEAAEKLFLREFRK